MEQGPRITYNLTSLGRTDALILITFLDLFPIDHLTEISKQETFDLISWLRILNRFGKSFTHGLV